MRRRFEHGGARDADAEQTMSDDEGLDAVREEVAIEAEIDVELDAAEELAPTRVADCRAR